MLGARERVHLTSSGAKGGVDGDLDEATATALERVRAALEGLAYGSVTMHPCATASSCRWSGREDAVQGQEALT